jgi:hypothetical protein
MSSTARLRFSGEGAAHSSLEDADAVGGGVAERGVDGRAPVGEPCGRLEDVADLLVEVVLAMDAVAAGGEQDRDAVPGPGGDLHRV